MMIMTRMRAVQHERPKGPFFALAASDSRFSWWFLLPVVWPCLDKGPCRARPRAHGRAPSYSCKPLLIA